MAVKQKSGPTKKVEVKNNTTFTFDVKPEAREVYVVGDFNDWDPRADRMVKRQGAFRKSLRLKPGEYQYKFVVDGEWHSDPSAAVQVHNEFGTLNSVIQVRENPKK